MERKFTELEKTILMAIFITVKNIGKYVRKEEILLKFPRRQRKMIRIYFDRLAKDGYIAKHPVGENYRLTEKGVKMVKRLLTRGATLWRI